MTDLETFTAAVIAAFYFTETGDEGQPDQDADLSPETRADLEADCRSFWHRFGCYVTNVEVDNPGVEQAGHDFWLTRNGHGAGFWDGDWPEPYGEMLTKASKNYGVFDTYLGDDGQIWGG